MIPAHQVRKECFKNYTFLTIILPAIIRTHLKQDYFCYAMKRLILFRNIFLLAVLFSLGINSSLNYTSNPFIIELSCCTNSSDNSLSSDIDPFDEDRIYQSTEYSWDGNVVNLNPIIRNCFLIDNFGISVWQPPKISQQKFLF